MDSHCILLGMSLGGPRARQVMNCSQCHSIKFSRIRRLKKENRTTRCPDVGLLAFLMIIDRAPSMKESQNRMLHKLLIRMTLITAKVLTSSKKPLTNGKKQTMKQKSRRLKLKTLHLPHREASGVHSEALREINTIKRLMALEEKR